MAEKKDEQDEKTPQKAPGKQPEADDSSMINRVQSSATGLLRNAFAPSGAADLNADLAGSLLSTEKPSSSQSGRIPGSSLSATETSRLSSNAPGAAGDAQHSLQSETFRSNIPIQEDGLENTYLGETNSNDLLYDLSDTKGKGKGVASTPDQPTTNETLTTAWNTTTQPPDGADVVTLLSNPSFDPSLQEEDQDTDLEPTPLSPTELSLIDSFRRHPSNPQTSSTHHSTPTPINPLSLIPGMPSATTTTSTTSTSSELESTLHSLPGISEWVDLDKTYHAEVWGYLRPHIRAAMDEIEEKRGSVKGDGGEGEGPAVRRLKMILRHMRGG
ncbi:hypothetical protein FQN54_003432 [Arachnomyces sp. PD_36]|nr:hypothetical protein FQN54_003432 [Arachnomyces sp. PD_36]